MFERFTAEARRAVVVAQEEARELRAERLGPGHLLLGVAEADQVAAVLARIGCSRADLRRRVGRENGDGLDGEALASLGIDLDRVRAAVEARFGSGALDRPAKRWRGGHIPFDTSAKKALECALREAIRLRQKEIRAWHLLLGVLRADPDTADRLVALPGAHAVLRAAAEGALRERAA